MLTLISPLWAVHIADGVLSWPWLVVGFLVAGVLVFFACWRVSEDEIPHIAILTAAFFVASSIHVRVGPTSVHLLLAGLVGVLLRWRAPLAILLGVAFQAVLIPHGGLTTIGINATTQTLSALVACVLFPVLLALSHPATPGGRSLLVGVGASIWGGFLLLGIAVLINNPLPQLVRFSTQGGLVVSLENLQGTGQLFLHPASLLLLGLFVLGCVLAERRVTLPMEFPAGALVGMVSVLVTTLLTGAVLLADGAERWSRFVSVMFLAHLPLALLEGLLLGMTVGFLARVKPALLRPAASC